MGKPATLKIDILADVANAAKGIDSIDKKLGGLGKLATGAAIAGGAVVAGRALLGVAGDALAAAEAGAALTRTTDQLLQTTGNAASTSTAYLLDYADAMARNTGISDDVIQASQNMLLTFNRVSNEVDDGTGIFDRATKAAADLAGAGFGSMETNATQLGKALQDPTKGMTALTRSGVSFTKQEQETIKALQESGQLFQAQNIILKAVENQVGGAAEASATASQKLEVVWGQTLETLGTALLPIIDKLLPVLTKLLDALIPVVLPVVDLIAELAGELIDALAPAIEPLLPVLGELGKLLAEQLGGVIRQIAPLLPQLTQALADILMAILPLIPSVVEISLAFAPLLPYFVKLIQLVAALATRVLPLLERPLRILADLYGAIGRAIAGAIGWVEKFVRAIGGALSGVRDLINAAKRIPGVGTIGRLLPWSVPVESGVSTFGASGGRTGRSSTTRIQVDVTGIGFDSILTGRALARQLSAWQTSNGLSPVQWAERNGGLPA